LMSKVVADGSRKVKFPLNEPAAGKRKSQIDEYLEFFGGPGVQHIALATDDLVATAAQLKKNGVRLLPIPENYYDDLEAKTDLPADQIALFRANDILYDREGNSEYLQVYTETFDKRFFFEIVQRKGYRGYGAANAPVRLAAQARLAPADVP